MKNKKTNLFLFLSAPLFLSFFSIVSASSTEKEPKSTERWSTLKQTVMTLGELRFKAKKVQLSLKTKLVNALHEKGHEFEALTPTNVKGYERLIQKVATDYHFDFSKITDIARMSLVFDSMCSLEKAYKTLLEDAHFKSKYKIIKK
ncbi:hypothetical protein OAN22_02715 [Alphaproteobacteria bacterium]|nr:hypothetical protein [Alphaproteobacteria bacterium]